MDAALSPRRTRRPLTKTEGYLILGGTLLGLIALSSAASSAVSSFLKGRLPKDSQTLNFMTNFTTNIIGRVVEIGIIGLSAPLFIPVSSKFTQRAFGLGRDGEAFEGHNPTDLEKLWWRSQEHYSQNANMARNVLSHFLVSIQDNISSAHQALQRGDEGSYAASRVAEAALRMRTLFAEIHSNEPVIAISVKAGLGDHLSDEQKALLFDQVMSQLQAMDMHFKEPGVEDYYRQLLASWLPFA